MIMSRCIVPKWNARQHSQERGGEKKISPHVHSDQNLCYAVPMCNNEVTELAWENGHLSLHGLGGKAGDTLESIVHHATSFNNGFSTSSAANWEQDRSMPDEQNDGVGGKLLGEMRGTSDELERKSKNLVEGSAIAADTTTVTWPSFESPTSFKTARTDDDDSLYHDCSGNQDGEGTTKGESYKSQSSARRSLAATTHNLSERRRRDRINQKMKTLQKLVPNVSKSDKASMLDEVIQYLKQLQAQVRMMSKKKHAPNGDASGNATTAPNVVNFPHGNGNGD